MLNKLSGLNFSFNEDSWATDAGLNVALLSDSHILLLFSITLSVWTPCYAQIAARVCVCVCADGP